MDEETTFTNESCPSQCSTDHPAPPTPRVRARSSSGTLVSWQFTCPETGEEFLWCHGCGEWLEYAGSWSSSRSRDWAVIEGHHYCDPLDHGYDRCYHCDVWVPDHGINYDRNENVNCDSCYERYANRGEPPESVRHCNTCGTANIHMDLVTERFLCKCQADELLVIKHPVYIEAYA